MKNNPHNKTSNAGTGKDILKLFQSRDKKQNASLTLPSGEIEVGLFNIWKGLLHHFYNPFPTVEHYE